MNRESAVRYIRKYGNDFHQACLDYLLSGTEPDLKIMENFLILQNNDGGFPCDGIQGHPSSINETLTTLYRLDEVGQLTSPVAIKALGFLLATQRTDGGWDEDPSLAEYDLPPWDIPGNLDTRLFLSAYSTFWFGMTECDTQAFQKSLNFLVDNCNPQGKFPGFPHTTWIALSAFLLAGLEYNDIVRDGIQALIDRPFKVWEDSQIAWAINNLALAGLDKSHLFIENGLAELSRRQNQNGAWVSEDGEAHTVDATLEVLRAFMKD